MKEKITNKVKDLLRDYIGEIGYETGAKISPSCNLKNDLGFDSLDVMLFLGNLETEYEIVLSPDEEDLVTNNPTVENIVDVIYNHINK